MSFLTCDGAAQDTEGTMEVLDKMKAASLLRGKSLDGSLEGSDDDVTYFQDDSFDDPGDDLLESGPYENINVRTTIQY